MGVFFSALDCIIIILITPETPTPGGDSIRSPHADPVNKLSCIALRHRRIAARGAIAKKSAPWQIGNRRMGGTWHVCVAFAHGAVT